MSQWIVPFQFLHAIFRKRVDKLYYYYFKATIDYDLSETVADNLDEDTMTTTAETTFAKAFGIDFISSRS